MIATKTAPVAYDFTAIDSDRWVIRLMNYRGKKQVVLVFYHGFSCPYCRKHLEQLHWDYQKFVDRQTEVIAIVPEDAGVFSDFWHAEKMPLIGIPDSRHIIADLFRQKINPPQMGQMPALIVIDKEGRMRYQRYGEEMGDTPSNDDILSLLDDLNNEPTRQWRH
jgi:peroxiredoxin